VAIDGPQRFAQTGAQSRGKPRMDERTGLIAEIEVGAVIDGTVARITPYGAFLQLEDGRLGLVHISEVDRN
jgi:ribosomal protein S1